MYIWENKIRLNYSCSGQTGRVRRYVRTTPQFSRHSLFYGVFSVHMSNIYFS